MKLEKGLYGLRQGARLFHQKFRKDLLAWGFRASTADPCLFIKHRNGSVFRILLFVDDMALMSDSTDDGRSMRDDLLKRVANKYKFSTQPDDNVYLGMAVDRIDETTVFLNQTRYIGDVLRKYGFDGGRSTYTPSAGQPVRVDDCWMDAAESEWVDKYKDKFVECGGKMVPVEAPPRPKSNVKDNPFGRRYRELCGVLRWIEQCTRPDISAALSELCKVQINPGPKHMKMMEHMMRYLHTTKDAGLLYGGTGDGRYPDGPLVGYVDSDWAGDKESFYTRGGYNFMAWSGVVSWSSYMIKSVAASSCEAEYMSAAQAVRELMWLRYCFSDLGHGALCPVT